MRAPEKATSVKPHALLSLSVSLLARFELRPDCHEFLPRTHCDVIAKGSFYNSQNIMKEKKIHLHNLPLRKSKMADFF
jgi:hypothetical protein